MKQHVFLHLLLGFLMVLLLAGCEGFFSPLKLAKAIYHMDGEDPSKIVDAVSGYSVLAFKTDIVDSPFGKARRFDGKESYIRTRINLRRWDELTISLWIRPEAIDYKKQQIILDNGHTENRNCALQTLLLSDDIATNRIFFVWHCFTTDAVFELPLNEWSHLIVTLDMKNELMGVYVNGTLVNEMDLARTKNFTFGSTPLYIGRWAVADERHFKGSIDELVVWDRRLTDIEIDKIHKYYKAMLG